MKWRDAVSKIIATFALFLLVGYSGAFAACETDGKPDPVEVQFDDKKVRLEVKKGWWIEVLDKEYAFLSSAFIPYGAGDFTGWKITVRVTRKSDGAIRTYRIDSPTTWRSKCDQPKLEEQK